MIKLSRKPAIATDQTGIVLVTVMVVISVLMIIGIALLNSNTSQYGITSKSTFNDNALLAAEAGVEQSLQQLNQSDSFSGYGSDQSFFNSAVQGKGAYTTTIAASPSDANAKVITSTGKVYKYGTTSQISSRIVKVTVVGTSSSGYSVYSGPGGLILGGSAGIINSQVYVNGTITMTGAAKIGTSGQPLNVSVANQACPAGASPGATYPSVCSGTQPISLAYSTYIYGTVCATGQTSTGPNNNIQGGSSGSGLKASCTAPPISMPTYDRSAHIARMTTTGSGTSNTYVCSAYPFDRTWPANLKLTGNVSVSSSCNVVIKGDVYITGDFDLSGAAKITVDNSVGTTRPKIVVDGKITVGGSGQLIANSSGTGIDFYSFQSSASCNPNCTSLSGNNLKTSAALETINIGGAANLPGMIFDAYWGKLTIGGSGSIGSAIGQTIDMSGAGTVTFGTSLSSGSHTWTVTSYQQKFAGKP